MSTRSNIGILEPDGKFEVVYCHWDGHPDSNGVRLLLHWNKPEAIRQLLLLGDMSCLGKVLGKKHPIDRKQKYACKHGWEKARETLPEEIEQWCQFYGRDGRPDQKEGGTSSRVYDSFADFVERELKDSDAEYVYVFDVKKGKWLFTSLRSSGNQLCLSDLKPLNQSAIIKDIRKVYIVDAQEHYIKRVKEELAALKSPAKKPVAV